MLQSPRIFELRADMRPIFFFALLAVMAASILPRYMGQLGGAAHAPSPAAPAPAAATTATAQVATTEPTSSGWRVVVRPDRRGHFRVEGVVDGRGLDFMVDTGVPSSP